MLHYDEETGKFSARVEKGNHYTVTDCEDTYLTDLTKPGTSIIDQEGKKIPEGTDALEFEEVVEGEASDRDDDTEHLSDIQSSYKWSQHKLLPGNLWHG